MARKPAKEQGDTLRIIIDSALALFGKFGYDGVSVDQIAQKSKLSKGAMYWHFKNKDELYLACLKEVHDLFNRYVFSAMASTSDTQEAVDALLDGIDTMLHDRTVIRGISGFWLEPSGRADTKQIGASIRTFEEQALEILSHMLESGAKNGYLKLSNDVHTLSVALFSLIETAVITISRSSAEEKRQTTKVLLDAFMRAHYSSEHSPLAA